MKSPYVGEDCTQVFTLKMVPRDCVCSCRSSPEHAGGTPILHARWLNRAPPRECRGRNPAHGCGLKAWRAPATARVPLPVQVSPPASRPPARTRAAAHPPGGRWHAFPANVCWSAEFLQRIDLEAIAGHFEIVFGRIRGSGRRLAMTTRARRKRGRSFFMGVGMVLPRVTHWRLAEIDRHDDIEKSGAGFEQAGLVGGLHLE